MNYNNIPVIELEEEYEATGKEFVVENGEIFCDDLLKTVEIEGGIMVDVTWEENDPRYDKIPTCECCGEKIKQFLALHILSGKKRVWICDRCIEDMKEVTGW